jgi:hypothetical protein
LGTKMLLQKFCPPCNRSWIMPDIWETQMMFVCTSYMSIRKGNLGLR